MAYRLCLSFNNFHGKLRQLFHVLSDDKVGSAPRFLPGSLAQRKTGEEEMDVEVVEDSSQAHGTPRPGSSKRKNASDEETSSPATKLRPRR
jgi:hypothetical protein